MSNEGENKYAAASTEKSAATDVAAAVEPDEVEASTLEDDEQARIDAACRAGREAAEAELAAEQERRAAADEADDGDKGDVASNVDAALERAQVAEERFLRLQADWENFRRRTAAERIAERERAAESLVTNLLPIIDDIERACAHAGAADTSPAMQQFVEGVMAVQTKMLSVLAKEGVEPIDPAGEAFDPLCHQAVGRVENPEVFDETVAEVYQKGYRMAGRVIRSAMVTVAFGGPSRPVDEAEDDQAAAGTDE